MGAVQAVDKISFSIRKGESFGLVGETGCGKSTTGLCLLRLIEPTSGEIIFDGNDILKLNKADMRILRGRMQVIFQNPISSLNPRLTVFEILKEGVRIKHPHIGKRETQERVLEIMQKVGLPPVLRYRYPHELSGGQAQRVAIARALSVDPELIIADEPVSALDISIQAQILNLLKDLQEQFGLTYIFISHDLRVVQHVCDRVAVMYLGKIAEIAITDEIFGNPLHPYTQTLASAIPNPDPARERNRIILKGEVPSPINPPSGCRFHPRCPYVMKICSEVEPELLEKKEGHLVSCHLY